MLKELGRVTSRDGTSIAFERTGTGPALILVDAAGCFRGFGPMVPLAGLLESRFTVTTYDRRGRGESADTPPYAVEREIEDLRSLIDAAGGSAFVYGFSSGAVLAMHAAASGLTIPRLALLEPPLPLDGRSPSGPDLGKEIAELVGAGKRREAIEHFQTSIGVPAEMIEGMRRSPLWPSLESLAHTLVYDTVITSSLPPERLRNITMPTLVLASEGSDERLRSWAQGVRDFLPNASLRTLQGEWHGPSPEAISAALADFFIAESDH